MQVERVITGNLEENCYIVSIDDKCLVVDPGDNFDLIKSKIGDKKVLKALITHKHFDHIGALHDIMDLYNINYMDSSNVEEKEYNIDSFNFQVIFTFGHSKDSITYYFSKDNIMFTGDFIFKGTIGRCDLEGGNYMEMLKSIEKIKKYSDSILVFPGHGDYTTLGEEKLNNPYF